MKNSKKVFDSAGQSPSEVKKSTKHDANLQKNSSLYFQIGLILCLLGTYGLFEMQFQGQKIVIDTIEVNDLATIDIAPLYAEEVLELEKSEPEIDRSTELIDVYKEIENDEKILEAKLITPEERKPVTKSVNPTSLPDVVDPEDADIFVPFARIEKAPIYPGCERYSTNDDRKHCMSEKITKLILKKFNTDIASEYGLSGVQKINTQFTIDKNGNVVDIKVRAPHPALEKAAQRIIDKIPNMIPGYQRAEPVGVIYTLPISFQVQ
jgi:protein TonB